MSHQAVAHISLSRSFWIVSVALILLMFISNRILYVRYLPESVCYFAIFISLIVYFRYNFNRLIHTTNFNLLCISWLGVTLIYDQFFIGVITPLTLAITLLRIICAFVVLNMPLTSKKWLLRIFIITVQILVGMALLGWILFLIGIPMPHFTNDSDAYYIHTIYPFFNLNGFPETQLIPRFAGPFLEPGHLGTLCVFLLYVQQFNLRKFGNVILLIGVLFSLSLAAYGLMIGAVMLALYNKRRYKTCVFIFGFFIICGLGATLYNGGDNPINQAIVLRLEMDENGQIAGNNRTTNAFEATYTRFLSSNDIWFGYGRKAFGVRGDGTDNITIGCATYKRYFFLRGIIGSFLIISFLILYWYKYRDRKTLGFLIVYVVANCIRDYPTMEMWLYVYLIAIPVLCSFQRTYHSSGHYNLTQNTSLQHGF